MLSRLPQTTVYRFLKRSVCVYVPARATPEPFFLFPPPLSFFTASPLSASPLSTFSPVSLSLSLPLYHSLFLCLDWLYLSLSTYHVSPYP